MGRRKNNVLWCPKCERHITGSEHGAYDIHPDYSAQYWTQRSLLSCPDCEGAFLVEHDAVEDRDDFGMDYVEWTGPVVLHPGTPETLDPAVPTPIAVSYLEARKVFANASSYTAAAIMCRRTLEGICNHFGASGSNLKSKLDHMKKEGIIEPRLHEWADHALRLLGNDAAHDVDVTISREDAKDALDFTKAIIEYLFVFQAAFDRFKARRAPKASGTQATSPVADDEPEIA